MRTDNAEGDLDIAAQTTITGAGRDQTILSGGQVDRVIEIRPGSEVQIRDLTIRDGQAPLEQGGGGLLNRGVLELVNVTVTNNRAGNNDIGDPWGASVSDSGTGGGILNLGDLTLENVLVSHNWAGDGVFNPTAWSYNGPPGGGGGGISNSGRLVIENSSISVNRAGQGCNNTLEGTHEAVFEYAGVGGDGGGILNLGELWATNTLFDANWAGEGGNGLGCVTSAEDP